MHIIKIMQKLVFHFILLLLANNSFAQIDSSKKIEKLMDEIVITSTRTETKLNNVAVPTKIISKKYIQQTGGLKLQNILQDYTGIVIVNSNLSASLNGYPNPFGQGIQMLGLDPAYTAVLIDGEPLVGRNAGILKLGRLATGNIKQVEIVKGPSSSLYGSEAMAGVINILTDLPMKENAQAQLHASSNNTFAQTLSYTNRQEKMGVQLFMNRYSTDGYDLDNTTYGKTIDPYRDWTMNVKLTQTISPKTKMLVSFRNFDSKQDNNYQITWQTAPAIVKGYTKEKDNSLFTQFTHNTTKNSKLFFRIFYNNYDNNSFVNLENTETRFDETSFIQSILKPEIQIESNSLNRKYIAGIGTYFETIDASRYAGKQKLTTAYTFTQNEWSFLQKKLTLIAGARLDKRTDYSINLSPRIAIAFKPTNHWKFTTSAGYGFKAPDFRHMYLNFYNAQIGYSLIGANILSDELTRLQQLGELENGIDISPYLTKNILLPEKSFGTHLGAAYSSPNINIEMGIFRNDINNLIDVYLLPFKKTSNRSIYSYHNTNRIYTQGAEFDFKYIVSKHISLALGYQYLEAKDKAVIEEINAGKLYRRDPITYKTSLVTKADYFGLNNRSRNTFNAKITLEDQKRGLLFLFRFAYRGKYAFTDVDGDNIADNDKEFVKSYTIANFTMSKKISNHLTTQVGVDNFLNYTNSIQMPNIAGKLFFINVNYSINHLINKN